MANTTNYNWATPDNTDLVKDGAAAIRTLGNSIDTTTKALNPETTLGDIAYRSSTSNTNTRLPIGSNGQILGVSAGVPAWINNDQGDITEVQAGTGISVASGTGPIPVVTNTVATAYDAKGDLIVGTGADTFSKLSVGTNGYTLVADSAQTSGVKWAVDPVADVVTTAGDLIYATAADTVTRLGIGTAGQVLKVNSGATAPEWGAVAAGGMTSLASGNLPAANTVTLSSISGSYIDLVLYVRDFYFAADDYLCLRVNGATGATDYGWIAITQSAENTAAVNADGLRDRLFFTADDGEENSDKNTFALCQFPDYANASTIKALCLRSVVRDQTNTYNTQQLQFGNYNSTSAISSITLFTQNGSNFSGGSYELYGVK